MSFYQLSTGETPKGDESANIEQFTVIPEGTIANSKIIRASYIETKQYGKNDKYYEFEYELLDGEFKGLHVRQKVRCFETEPSKKDKAINMLVRIMTLTKFSPGHAMAPTESDLQALLGKQLQVKVGQWDMKGNTGNFVRGVYGYNEKPVETGIYEEPKSQKEGDERNPPPLGGAPGLANDLNDDIPF